MTGRELFEYLKSKGMADEVLRISADGYDDWCDIETDNIEDYCDVILINIEAR